MMSLPKIIHGEDSSQSCFPSKNGTLGGLGLPNTPWEGRTVTKEVLQSFIQTLEFLGPHWISVPYKKT